MQLDIMKAYPLLSSWNNHSHWTGFISIDNNLVRVAVNTPNFPTTRGAIITGDEHLKGLCEKSKCQLNELIESDCPVLSFLQSFVDVMKLKFATAADPDAYASNPYFYSTLVHDLDKIGLQNITFASKNYYEIHTTRIDPSGREHTIKYFLSSKYPRVPLKVVHELPVTFSQQEDNIQWPQRISEADLLFAEQLVGFDEFWTEMDDFDRATRVIDPSPPNPSHCHRRILLENKIIVHLIFNPKQPRAFPRIAINGPPSIVAPVEALVERNCKNWCEDESIIYNLERLLQVSCMPLDWAETVTYDHDLVCTVCYTYSFEGEIPDRNCECGANYHNKCLSDLFSHEFMTNKKNCVECPNCGADLKLQIQTM